MSDIVDRLSGYNPPDRTTDDQLQTAQDIYDAKVEIERLRAVVDAAVAWNEATDMNIESAVDALQSTVMRYLDGKP